MSWAAAGREWSKVRRNVAEGEREGKAAGERGRLQLWGRSGAGYVEAVAGRGVGGSCNSSCLCTASCLIASLFPPC